MSINLNPLMVIIPAWIASMSLLGLARIIKKRAEKRIKPATIVVQNNR